MDAIIVFCIGLYYLLDKKSAKVVNVDIPMKMNPMCYEDEDAFNRYPKLLLK